MQDSAENDEANLESIYDRYAESLFRYALALTGSADDAEDAVQEVFFHIARETKRLRQIENLKAYLYTSTRNSAYTILRHRKRKNEIDEAVSEEWDEAENVDFDGIAIAATIVRDVFPKLPVEQREVLVLKIFDDMTFREISDTTGVAISTITARYRYGIQRLRRALRGDDNG